MATAAIIALSLFQADQQIRQGEAKAKAAIEQADIENVERRKRTRALAGQQKVSFLNSGLTLEGTPMAAIQQTFETGIEDVELASRNAERQAKSIMINARSQAIGGLIQGGAGAFSLGNEGFDIAGGLRSNTGGIGNVLNRNFGTTLRTGGGGQITGSGIPIPARKPVGIRVID